MRMHSPSTTLIPLSRQKRIASSDSDPCCIQICSDHRRIVTADIVEPGLSFHIDFGGSAHPGILPETVILFQTGTM